MAVTVPDRDLDQVKINGAEISRMAEVRENMDGGSNTADHRTHTGENGRIFDHGINDMDYINQSPDRFLRQSVGAPGGSPQLVFHKNTLDDSGQRIGNVGGTLLTTT